MGALAPDPRQVQRFLEVLDPDAEAFTFQTFDDSDLGRGHIAKVVHGEISEAGSRLTTLNKSRAGIFVTVNETDLRGRRAENVRRVRAVFADLDGAPLEPVMACALDPHTVVESSPGRFHAYCPEWFALPVPEAGQSHHPCNVVDAGIAVEARGDGLLHRREPLERQAVDQPRGSSR